MGSGTNCVGHGVADAAVNCNLDHGPQGTSVFMRQEAPTSPDRLLLFIFSDIVLIVTGEPNINIY
jgi:hypothetical protein